MIDRPAATRDSDSRSEITAGELVRLLTGATVCHAGALSGGRSDDARVLYLTLADGCSLSATAVLDDTAEAPVRLMFQDLTAETFWEGADSDPSAWCRSLRGLRIQAVDVI